VILDEAEALLDPVSDIEGFMLAYLVEASTGMVLASRKDAGRHKPAYGGGRGGRHCNVLSQLTGELPVDGLEDVMVTFRRQLYVIRLVSPEPQILPGDRAAAPDRRGPQHGNAPVLRPQRRIHLLQGRQGRLCGIDPDSRSGPA
jgi:hypothetical protein